MQEFWNTSEFGDKTFLTTSIFSLKYPRWLVFISSMFALTTMNIVSLFLGKITANIPTYIIETISIILFAKQNGGLQWAVGFGSFLGNFFTNSIAILCSTIVSEIISIRTVQIIGGFTFIFCSIFKYYYS
ncbi:hypothetical protein DERP_014973 [Dermatophagoides pteronyssinus]|uniref:GDT1 family protein n=1 Tax=Dermatophagoides pteronyssinus TaxID=6956 RepID=A0ABQ8JGZ1_DERPT|nr:hypothetical protein DERP_014973 [Dermatophagoides pteronyssinus]